MALVPHPRNTSSSRRCPRSVDVDASGAETQGKRIDRPAASGIRIVILDKTDVGAGASGIACGVVRNNYYQPAMRELMAHSVSVWESDRRLTAITRSATCRSARK
jgi:hypothetical protein